MSAKAQSDDAPTINKHQGAPKSGWQYDVPRGHRRPGRFEGRVLRVAPYELPESEYKSESRDVRMVQSPSYND
jgi:hypothetical protein